jgi:outer membrane protein assembly factor BamB
MWTQPAIGADGTAFYGSDSGELVAVGPPRTGTLGELRWSLHGVNPGLSPALADDGTIYVSGDDWNLHAISPPGGGTGAERIAGYNTHHAYQACVGAGYYFGLAGVVGM